MALDSNFILFSPVKLDETASCVRMLRNYKKKPKPIVNGALVFFFFSNVNPTTPNQLRLYKESDEYVLMCSQLLYLSIKNKLAKKHIWALKDVMTEFKYWEKLGFNQ